MVLVHVRGVTLPLLSSRRLSPPFPLNIRCNIAVISALLPVLLLLLLAYYYYYY